MASALMFKNRKVSGFCDEGTLTKIPNPALIIVYHTHGKPIAIPLLHSPHNIVTRMLVIDMLG